jgi:hypothetical protein
MQLFDSLSLTGKFVKHQQYDGRLVQLLTFFQPLFNMTIEDSTFLDTLDDFGTTLI